MNLITHRIEELPASFGAFDRICRLAAEQSAENDAHDADLAARTEMLAEEAVDLLTEGDAKAPALFAKPKRDGSYPELWTLFYEALEQRGLVADWCQLSIDIALGMDKRREMAQMLKTVLTEWARLETM